jgi:hypothetical protein
VLRSLESTHSKRWTSARKRGAGGGNARKIGACEGAHAADRSGGIRFAERPFPADFATDKRRARSRSFVVFDREFALRKRTFA